MRQKNNGRGAGLTLALLLIVALVIAFLAVKQLPALGMGKGADAAAKSEYVTQALTLVDQINTQNQKLNEVYP